jgi:hypothetical protein
VSDRFRRSTALALSLVLILMLIAVIPAGADVPHPLHPFQETWTRTDRAVNDGVVTRTWMWGPQSSAYQTTEPYKESPDGQRSVIYFDKARMEITDPLHDREDPWFVTNGLLVVELITGRMQLGNDVFQQRGPAWVNVAGDHDDPIAPTYASFATVMAPYTGPRPDTITRTISRLGHVSNDERFAAYDVGVDWWEPATGHWVADVFWDFMTSNGIVWDDEMYVLDHLFPSPFYATGLPITEAYWTTVLVAGTPLDVLAQCFERRCLTYTPGNAPGWEVEAGNVGLHYYVWRYGTPPPKPVG